MTSAEIVSRFTAYYQTRGHRMTPNVSLVPEGDSTLLFVNSGMFPLVPYLTGEPHPMGKRLMNVQRAIRLDDIEAVGDYNHTSCFHMMGNWSLGDYFKAEQLAWVYQLYIDEFRLDPRRLFASVFAGDQYAPRDDDSIRVIQEIFQKHGIEARLGERIFAYGKEDNWWQRGDAVGELGGPDSEIFYYLGRDGSGLGKDPAVHKEEFLEIGNSVFMQFRRTATGWEELPQQNVDFGGGLERLAMVIQGKQDIFSTDNFLPIIRRVEELSGHPYRGDEVFTKAMRVLADHVRAASFLAMDGVIPSNKDQGYVLRRYLRRIVRFGRQLGIVRAIAVELVPVVSESFHWIYPELAAKESQIMGLFREEEEKFRQMLDRAAPQVAKRLGRLGGEVSEDQLALAAFDLYQSLGYPPEIFLEDAYERYPQVRVDRYWASYQEQFLNHQTGSRIGAEKKFKGGLADHSEDVKRYHTATHLLQFALREILGRNVVQHGSNITGQRLRFDFNYDQRLSAEQIAQVERIVNQKIEEGVAVGFVMLSKAEAEKTGAVHAFNEKYGDQVTVYYIGPSLNSAFSKEFCGGPHVHTTAEIGPIKIYKQESVGKGVRRVYARFAE